MILLNKLIRVDLVLLVGFFSLFFVPAGGWRDALIGFVAAALVISMAQHISHYKSYKKFY
jgi:uncharacterized membrane protein YjjP (DUF1212 family)